MQRFLLPGLLPILFVLGCCSTPDRDALRLMPEDNKTHTYAELYQRARTQVSLATEAFYTNDWFDLEDSARALNQTANFLPKATEIPAKIKNDLPKNAGELSQQALQLRKAARAKKVDEVNATLQTIHLKIRNMHPEQE